MYLFGTTSRSNKYKKAELNDRIKQSLKMEDYEYKYI